MELLSLAEIAHELGIPESNARYYRNKFDDYLPSVGTGRTKRYQKQAIEVMRVIAEGFKGNFPAEAIEEQLQKKFGIPHQVTTTNKPQTINQPAVLELVAQKQRELTTTMQSVQNETTELKQQIQYLKEQLEAQSQLIDGHYKLVDQRLRDITEKKEKKSWWRRLFRS